MTFLTKDYIKRWRKLRDISRSEMGRAMGYRSGDYVKKIELGILPITSKFARQFSKFKYKNQVKERRTILSRYPLPAHIKILARPKKCLVCKEWFVFPNESDRVCTDRKCRRIDKRKKGITRDEH